MPWFKKSQVSDFPVSQLPPSRFTLCDLAVSPDSKAQVNEQALHFSKFLRLVDLDFVNAVSTSAKLGKITVKYIKIVKERLVGNRIPHFKIFIQTTSCDVPYMTFDRYQARKGQTKNDKIHVTTSRKAALWGNRNRSSDAPLVVKTLSFNNDFPLEKFLGMYKSITDEPFDSMTTHCLWLCGELLQHTLRRYWHMMPDCEAASLDFAAFERKHMQVLREQACINASEWRALLSFDTRVRSFWRDSWLYERNLPEEDLWIINSAKKRFQDALIEEKVRQLETELKSVRDIRKNLEDQSPYWSYPWDAAH